MTLESTIADKDEEIEDYQDKLDKLECKAPKEQMGEIESIDA